MNPPEPEDAAFVARVHQEVESAHERAWEMLGKKWPGSKAKKPRQSGPTRRQVAVAERQEHVLIALCCGATGKEIAVELGVPRSTVEHTVFMLRQKYGARNVHHLTALAMIDLAENLAVTKARIAAEEAFRRQLNLPTAA